MSYLNVVELDSAIQSLAAAYPTTSELITLPHMTHEGRQSRALRIGTNADSAADGVLILGGVHAREWVPPDALVSLAADLLEAFHLGTGLVYGGQSFSAGEIRQVMESLNLLIYPCVNSDGRHHSQTQDALWRKNRRAHASGGDCIGVDLNRNFDFLWDHQARFASDSGVRTSADPCDRQVYRGPAAASEPEVRNVVWLLDTYPRIRWHVDVHSAVPVILHAWGSDQNQSQYPTQNFRNHDFDSVRGRANDSAYGEFITSNDLRAQRKVGNRMNVAIKAVRGNNYGVEQAYGLYPTSGASDDYAFSRHFTDSSITKVFGFTVECGSSFHPSWSEAEEVIRETSAGLVAFCLEVAAATTQVASSQIGGDIALVRQTPGWATVPIAFSKGDGNFTITNGNVGSFATWARQPGVRVIKGDFDGHGSVDIALVRQTPGWGSIPIAFSKGDGTFTVTNGGVGTFISSWAHRPGVKVITGDFNGNGLTDIALVRQTPGWGSIPIAFSKGDGNFTVTNGGIGTFISSWAHRPGVKVITGDFNGNGLTDIALVRQEPGWATIPVAFSKGDGNFTVTNGNVGSFISSWAHRPGVQLITGDFNGNGLTDIALVRQTPGWDTIPIAFSKGDGNFTITNGSIGTFINSWAHRPGVRVVAGDFNGNGLTDIALVRQTPGWGSIPIAFSKGDGTFTVTNGSIGTFISSWAHRPGVQLITGDFNDNGLTDIALVRQTPGWSTIPIAFSKGDGTFTVTNGGAGSFITSWANQPGVRLVTGDFHG